MTNPQSSPSVPLVVLPMMYRCISINGFYYFDHLHELNHPPGIYGYLLSTGKLEIKIWDSYIYKDDAEILRNIDPNVDVMILTSWGCDKAGNEPGKVTPLINNLCRVQSQIGFGLNLRVYNKNYDPISGKNPFHDRFLFVDERVYVIGSSMEYHRRRMASTTISTVMDTGIKEFLNDKFDEIWKHSRTIGKLVLPGAI